MAEIDGLFRGMSTEIFVSYSFYVAYNCRFNQNSKIGGGGVGVGGFFGWTLDLGRGISYNDCAPPRLINLQTHWNCFAGHLAGRGHFGMVRPGPLGGTSGLLVIRPEPVIEVSRQIGSTIFLI